MPLVDRGQQFGRPRKVDDAEHITTAKRMKADGHTGKDIAKYLGVSRATFIATSPRMALPDRQEHRSRAAVAHVRDL